MKETYKKFWKEFGKNIKVGMVEDVANRKGLSEITRWFTTHDESKELTSLNEYVERKKEDQKEIYYLGGESLQKMKESPILKGLVSKGYEVLLLDDAIDEYSLHTLETFNDFTLTNIGKAGF